MYIEITYETQEIIFQYFKHDNTWVNIGEFNIYKKNNYKWHQLNTIDLLYKLIDDKYLVEVLE